jgi:hypothetical protein
VMHDNIHIPGCFENGMNKEVVILLIRRTPARYPGIKPGMLDSGYEDLYTGSLRAPKVERGRVRFGVGVGGCR